MPSWLGDGLTVTAVGMGVVILTLVLLSELIAQLGRLAGPQGGGRPKPPTTVETGRAAGPVPRGAPDGPQVALAPRPARGGRDAGEADTETGGEGAGDGATGPRLAAVAAAIAAYLEAEASRTGRAFPFRITAVERLDTDAGGFRSAAPSAGGAAWARAGRMELMLERQQIGPRRVRSKR